MKKTLLPLLLLAATLAPQAAADLCQDPFDAKAWTDATPDTLACLDVSATDSEGNTPLHHAVWSDRKPEIISRLIEQGADVNAKNNYNWTPLYFAISQKRNLDLAALLIKSGADINAVDTHGWTLLHHAVLEETPSEILTFLLENGANPNVQDQEGMTPLHYTAVTAPETYALLVEHGGDITLKGNDGVTPKEMQEFQQSFMGKLIKFLSGYFLPTKDPTPQ